MYPSFVYFHRGHPQLYWGTTDSFEDIHNWVYKKVHPHVLEISNMAQLWDIQDHQDVVIVYFGDTNTTEYQRIYTLVAKRYDKAFFTRSELGTEIADSYDIYNSPQVILLRKAGVDHVIFEKNWTHANFERWIVQKSVPDVLIYEQNYAYHIFTHKHIALFLFRDERE